MTVMSASSCGDCPFRGQCPVRKANGRFLVTHTVSQHRLASRRAEQATEGFRENYAIRGGGESVNAGLKRRTGMGRVRVRGAPRVSMAVLLRCAGWNLFRALTVLKKRGAGAFAAVGAAFSTQIGLLTRLSRRVRHFLDPSTGKLESNPNLPRLTAA